MGAILGLPTNLDGQILQEVQTQGYSRPRKIVLAGQFYALQALAEKEPRSEIYWLLSPWEARLDIQPEERPPLEVLLAQAVRGTTRTSSPAELANAYRQAVFSAFALLCARFGGEELGQRFAQLFSDWSACQEALELNRPGAVEACQDLLQRALEYVLLMVPADQVRNTLERLEAGLGDEIVQAANASGLRLHLPAH